MDIALAPAPPALPSSSVTGRGADPAPVRPAPAPVAPDVPAPRSVTARVTGGLDGALRVVMMLRGRRYGLRDLGLDVRDDGECRVACTVVATATDVELLRARLRRLPVVVAAE